MASWGIVSPVYTILRPRRGGPSTSSGRIVRPRIVTASPAWRLASVHRHALDQPRQREEMVAVEVGHEDAGDLHEAQLAQHELPLRAFAAVEQDHLGTALDRDRAHVPLRRRPRSGGAEEDD